jgi:hypothetical protein
MTVVPPALKSSRRLKLGYETFGLYPIVSLAFKFEQYAVVAARPLRQSFNLCIRDLRLSSGSFHWFWPVFLFALAVSLLRRVTRKLSAGCAKVAYIWQDIPAALDRR